MRGRNPWTAGYHGFLFFIVKSDIEIFVWSVDESKGFYFVCRDRASMQQVAGGPMSHRSQIAYLSIAQKHDLQKPSLVREGGNRTELAECRLTDE